MLFESAITLDLYFNNDRDTAYWNYSTNWFFIQKVNKLKLTPDFLLKTVLK